MELNREIRDEFRAAGQTSTARLAVARNLHRNYTKTEISSHITFVIQYILDTVKIGSNLLILGTAGEDHQGQRIWTAAGTTTLLGSEKYLRITRETTELAFKIIDAAPFGEKIISEGFPKDKLNVVIGYDIMNTIINLRCRAVSGTVGSEPEEIQELPDEVSHLGIILIKLGILTQYKLEQILEWIN